MMEQEFLHLKQHVTDIFSKIEKRLISLENKVTSLDHPLQSSSPTQSNTFHQHTTAYNNTISNLESDAPSPFFEDPEPTVKPKVRMSKLPVTGPVLKCVQCSQRYREDENMECSCIYHSGELKFVAKDKHVLTCCQVPVKSRRLARKVPGCTKARHCSSHHTDFTYTEYYIYMITMCVEALEVWLTVDILDPVIGRSEWGEVGLSSEGNMYVVVGYSREQPLSYSELSFQELRECKTQQTELVRRSDPRGWVLTVTLQAVKSVAKSITVSLRAAGYKSPLVKRLQLVLSGDHEAFRPGSVETLSDPTPPVSKAEYRVPADTMKGPVLRPGHDHSVGRRSDYLTERDNEAFPLTLTQMESVSVESSHIRQPGGKWNNLFTTTIMATNPAETEMHITDVYVQFQQGGEWVGCDQTWVAINTKVFSKPSSFSMLPRSDLRLSLRMAIAVEGALPVTVEAGRRAHFTLPQPLHFRVVFVGVDGLTASLRVEQGNTPLNLVTRQMREATWNDGNHMTFYIFADDVKSLRRTDAAIYFNNQGMLVYRVSPYGVDAGEQLITQAMLTSVAHTARKHKHSEGELTDLRREEYESSVRVYALVDTELGVPFAIKVFVTTPTSYSVGYFSLPRDDFSSASLSLQPDCVRGNSNIFLMWSVPRASSQDMFCVYTEHGSYSLSELVNDQAALTGAKQIRVPSTPGRYEVRYYPAWLSATNTAHQHSTFTLHSSFTVTA